MEKLLISLSMAGLLACSQSPTDLEPFPHYLMEEEEDWITYEGILPGKDGHQVKVELSLVPATPGMDSYYKIWESIESDAPGNQFASSIHSRGRYELLSSPGASIIRLIDKRKTNALFRAKVTPMEFQRELEIREDLILKGNGDHQLILVDDDFNAVDSRYILTRRNSPLFTVEGYFTVYGDTTDFFEKNTQKQWAVAQLGEYDKAVNKYTYLAKEKFEGVYVKALSYSVVTQNREGKDINALVFKRIIQIDSTRTIH